MLRVERGSRAAALPLNLHLSPLTSHLSTLDFLLRLALQLIEPLGLLWLGLIFLTLLLRRRR